MKNVIMIAALLVASGCKKAPSLESKYTFLYGTWVTSTGDVEVTLKRNGRMIVHEEAERGYDFRVRSTEIYTHPTGWTRINFLGRGKKEPLRVELYFWQASQKIALRSPFVEDSLTKQP